MEVSEEEKQKAKEVSEKQGPEENKFQALMAIKAEEIMNQLQLVVVYILVLLFGVAVYDLGVKLLTFTISGKIFQPTNVIAVLETALLLFLVVEVFRTSVAHLEGRKVLPLVIDVGIIGVVRSLITYRIGKFETLGDAFTAALSYSVTLAVLMLAFFVIHRQERKDPEKHHGYGAFRFLE